jgi:hypothetical protein
MSKSWAGQRAAIVRVAVPQERGWQDRYLTILVLVRSGPLGLRHLGKLSTDLDFGGSPQLTAAIGHALVPVWNGFNVDHCMAPTQISRLLLLAAAHFRGVATRPNAIQRCREAPDRIHLRA